MEFIGIDGCRSGWFCLELGPGAVWQFQVISASDEIVKLAVKAKLVLIDISIGLVDSGTEERLCDKEARRVLGAPRAASVFPVPARASLDATSYEQALALNRKLTGRGLTKQAWNIAPKIREIDQLMRSHSELQKKLKECHPEVCFWALNRGVPMTHSKKTTEGREERLSVLSCYLPQVWEMFDGAAEAFLRKEVALDDILDALVAAVTAKMAYQKLQSLPQNPPIDEYGLAMEISYADV